MSISDKPSVAYLDNAEQKWPDCLNVVPISRQ